MSFELDNVPTKADFVAANPVPEVSQPTEEQVYAQRKNNLQQRLNRFFSGGLGSTHFSARVGFLNGEDLAALTTLLEGKGYTVTVDNGLMSIR